MFPDYLIRYLDKEYVDQFFNDGTIMLSSIKQFAKHGDFQRFDDKEGIFMFLGKLKDQTIECFGNIGTSAYILCGTPILSKELMNTFKTNSYFKINDVAKFTELVADQLVNFKQCAGGPCIYDDSKIFEIELPDLKW